MTNTVDPACALDLLRLLKSARLMLYAWKGSRSKEWGEHEELNILIVDIERAIEKAEGRR